MAAIAQDAPQEGSDPIAMRDRVRADRLQLLYWQSFPALFISVAVAGLLALLLWPAARHEAVVLWMSLVVGTSLARLALFAAYRVKAPAGAALLAWERPYFTTLMAATLAWGLGAVWIMPKDSFLHQAITLVILVGMAGGALSVYSAVRWLALATIGVLLLPASAWLIAFEGRPGLYLGLAVLLFCLSAIRATRVLSQAMEQNFVMTYELREAKEAAERMAGTDALSGLSNRRAFLEAAQAPAHYCRRNALPMSAIVLDLDHFKRINDTHGHVAGDTAIHHAGNLIRASLRRSDLCCRWGGEEFVILLPDTPLAEAARVAGKLRAAIEAFPVPLPAADVPVTASLGVAEGSEEVEALIDRADTALYRAKREGRNRVACAEAPHP
ncbi:MAG: GGDEF domain-containing protein [Burkholderiales bacterium]|nr:GGDEF domain-containing protein [Burkholderiales bacterium]MCL4687717.1 GGDEF domain-containing protein [Burkholderiales bacterium]